MNLILFGFKKCGKTRFGQLLADELQCTFIDTDALIEAIFAREHGGELDCRAIYKKIGKEAFRVLEERAIIVLRHVKDSVIAIGGGAALDPANQQALAKVGRLVYLQVDKEILKKRMLSGELAAYLDPDDPEGSFEKMYLERKPIYEHIPATKLELAGKNDQLIIEELKALYHGK